MKDGRDTLIIVLSPEEAARESASDILSSLGEVTGCEQKRDLYEILTTQIPDVVLLDAQDSEAGSELLRDIHRDYPALPIIMFADGVEIDYVVECIHGGALDFVEYPFAKKKLRQKVEDAASRHQLIVEINQLSSVYKRRGQFGQLVGISPPMQQIYSIIENVAKTDVTLLITGESGTGKELVAKAIHDSSVRDSGQFVPVNCAAIPRELLESELFGHEKGSFTGAYNRRLGCCELANGGTLFLDEVCEMDLALQSKLLRFLQDRSFMRVGGNELIKVDTRVIAATNREPLEEVKGGKLREDLYYRLNVVPIEMPPLRERPEDIPILAQHFLEDLSERYGKYFVDFAPEAVQVMLRYDWPGNVRQLQNTIERIVVLATSAQVTADLFPDDLLETAGAREMPMLAVDEVKEGMENAPEPESDVMSIEEVERLAIIKALKKCKGDLSMTARKLGISRATLYRKIDKHQIR